MTKLRYTPAAIQDLDEIEQYIREELCAPDAAKNTIRKIANSCALLRSTPRMGLSLQEKLNREIPQRYIISGNYLIIYEIDESISVLRVLDTRTDYITILRRELS